MLFQPLFHVQLGPSYSHSSCYAAHLRVISVFPIFVKATLEPSYLFELVYVVLTADWFVFEMQVELVFVSLLEVLLRS